MKDYSRIYDAIKAGKIKVNRSSPMIQRFWNCVDKNGPEHPTLGRCWVWTGFTCKVTGYGSITVNYESIGVHRMSWLLHHGTYDKSLWICHDCDNRVCVNPSHLHLGDAKSNAKEMCVRERHVARGRKVLTLEEVRFVLENHNPGTGQTGYNPESNTRALAESLGVNKKVIIGIVGGKRYKHFLEIIAAENCVSVAASS